MKKTIGINCIVLTRSSCREEYFSPSLNKNVVKRIWTDISPLEAAAWCGDIFLVRELLNHVPKTKTQLEEALKQLEEMLNRKETAENGSMLAPYRALLKLF